MKDFLPTDRLSGPHAEAVDHALVSRYLRVLRLQRREASLEALSELTAAHLFNIPFENISKLWRHREGVDCVPEIAMFLDGIERFNFGGTCYSNNFHFHSLLRSLGYDARVCAADMASPGAHMVVIVALKGREYLVDVGYAAPFLTPMPLDLSHEFAVTAGSDRYVLHPQDADGASRMELYRDGALKHGYVVHPAAKRLADFAGVIAGSFRPAATFLNAILLARFSAAESVVIHNLRVMESRGGERSMSRVASREELPQAVEHHFGIPQDVVAEAIAGVGDLGDAWN